MNLAILELVAQVDKFPRALHTPARMRPISSIRRLRALLVLLVISAPTGAFAHADPTAHASGFSSGLQHPISGLDHVLAMVAVGIWGAQLGGRALWLLPLVFPSAMILGGALAIAGVELPAVELGIALSALVVGLLVVSPFKPTGWLASAVVGGFAVFHGFAHGAEIPLGVGAIEYSVGFVVMTALLHLAGIGIGMLALLPYGAFAVRCAGFGVALGGAWFVARTLGV